MRSGCRTMVRWNPSLATSSSSAPPARSAPRRSTSSGAIRTGSGWSALAAGGGQPDLLARQAAEFGPCRGRRRQRGRRRRGPRAAPARSRASPQPQILAGPDAVTEVAAWPCDVVLNGMTGAAGLAATLAALDGRRDARAGQQGVADRRRPAGHSRGQARARSSRSTPSTPRSRSACAAGARPRCAGWCSPRAAARSAAGRRDQLARRHAGAGARAPHLEHGPGGHDQLRDAGEQGPRGDRGAPAVRRRARPDRRRGASAVDRALDGGVRRRRRRSPRQSPPDMRLPIALGLAWPDRVPEAAPGLRLDHGGDAGPSSRSTTRPSRRSRWPAQAGRGRRHRARGVQRGERGVRGGLPGRRICLSPDCRHRGAR